MDKNESNTVNIVLQRIFSLYFSMWFIRIQILLIFGLYNISILYIVMQVYCSVNTCLTKNSAHLLVPLAFL